MNVPTIRKKEGFTIIEVVLVLAIAALILLMVFIALPALQRGQRDTARKNDVGSVASAVTSYLSNSRGKFPADGTFTTSGAGFSSYLSSVSDNTTSVLVQSGNKTKTVAPADATIVVSPATTCGDTDTVNTLKEGTTRQFTVVVKLESGGGAYFCQDS